MTIKIDHFWFTPLVCHVIIYAPRVILGKKLRGRNVNQNFLRRINWK